MRRMDGWLLAGLLLVFCGVGCAGSLVDRAQETENTLREVATAAHAQLKPQCDNAVDNADTPDKADAIIAACVKAERAWGVFVASCLTLDDAIAEARLAGEQPLDMQDILDAVEKAARDFLGVAKSAAELMQ